MERSSHLPFLTLARKIVLLSALALTFLATQGMGPALTGSKQALAADNKPAATAGQAPTLAKPFASLGVSGNDPIQFESDALEVLDQKDMAIFTGNVVARQKDTALRCKKLTVFYAPDTGEGDRKVKSMEAEEDVLVTSGEETATGDHGVFDTINQFITLTGNVVLTQGKNVIRGQKLTIDVNTGQAKVSGTNRVQMLIAPKSLDTKNGT